MRSWKSCPRARMIELETPLAREDLGVQNRRARRAADRIVPERLELPLEHGAAAETAHGDAHPAGTVRVETRLRAVVLRARKDWIGGRAREPELLQRTEAAPRLE